MKDNVIKCICEILQGYSLESEWTPDLESKILENANRISEGYLNKIILDYNPAGYLSKLGIEVSSVYFNNVRERWGTDTSIRYNLIKKYKIDTLWTLE